MFLLSLILPRYLLLYSFLSLFLNLFLTLNYYKFLILLRINPSLSLTLLGLYPFILSFSIIVLVHFFFLSHMLLSFSLTDSSFFSHSHTTFSFIPSLSLSSFYLSLLHTNLFLIPHSFFLFLFSPLPNFNFLIFSRLVREGGTREASSSKQASSIGVGGAIWTSKCVVYIQHRCLLCMFNDSRMGSNNEAIEAKAKLEKARDVCSDFREKKPFPQKLFLRLKAFDFCKQQHLQIRSFCSKFLLPT